MKPLVKLLKAGFKPSHSKSVIQSVDLEIYPGDFLILLGGNGSGKSSLIKLINQTYHHTSGEVLLYNKPILSYKNKELSKKIVTLNQFTSESLFMDLTIEENAIILATTLSQINSQFSKKLFINELKTYLDSFNTKLKLALSTPICKLSGGEQQILAFALYLRHQPDLLLLDEHTSALDPKTAAKIMAFTDKIIQKNKITCIMTTHNLDFAEKYGSRLIAIKDGKILYAAEKNKENYLTKEQMLDYCY